MDHGGRTLLATFNNTLVTYLEHLRPPELRNVDVRTYHRFARGYLHSRGLMNGEGRLARTMERYGGALDWIAVQTGQRNVLELERLAIALWITRRNEDAHAEWRAGELTRIKPHVSRDAALAAVREIDELLEHADAVAA